MYPPLRAAGYTPAEVVVKAQMSGGSKPWLCPNNWLVQEASSTQVNLEHDQWFVRSMAVVIRQRGGRRFSDRVA